MDPKEMQNDGPTPLNKAAQKALVLHAVGVQVVFRIQAQHLQLANRSQQACSELARLACCAKGFEMVGAQTKPHKQILHHPTSMFQFQLLRVYCNVYHDDFGDSLNSEPPEAMQQSAAQSGCASSAQ